MKEDYLCRMLILISYYLLIFIRNIRGVIYEKVFRICGAKQMITNLINEMEDV